MLYMLPPPLLTFFFLDVLQLQQSIVGVSNAALNLVEGTVDRFFPADESATTKSPSVADTTDNSAASTSEVAKVIVRARRLVSKTQSRAFTRAMSQLQFVQTRSQAAVDTMRAQATNLLEYAAKLDAEGQGGVQEGDGAGWTPLIATTSTAAAATTATAAQTVRDTVLSSDLGHRAVRLAAHGVVATTASLQATVTNLQAKASSVASSVTAATAAARTAAHTAVQNMRLLVDLAIQHATELRDADNRVAFVAADFAAVSDTAQTVTSRAVVLATDALHHAADLRRANDRVAFLAADVTAVKSLLREWLWPSPSDVSEQPSSEHHFDSYAAAAAATLPEEPVANAESAPRQADDEPASPPRWREVDPDSLPVSPTAAANDVSFDSMVGSPRSLDGRDSE